jgi:Zn-dependent protease
LTSLVLGVVMVGLARALGAAAVSPLLVGLLAWLGLVNVVIAVFNALPGAPLDGGRLLHAVVWSRHGDPLRATRAATRAGSALGATLILAGVIELARPTAGANGVWLVFLGWFLRSGARAEADNAGPQPVLEPGPRERSS